MENLRSNSTKGNWFKSAGMKISPSSVVIGNTYPIFGMITRLINDKPGEVVCEINHNIHAKMTISDQDKVELLKKRAFESGIFISKVSQKEPQLIVDCQTVIFGKPQDFQA